MFSQLGMQADLRPGKEKGVFQTPMCLCRRCYRKGIHTGVLLTVHLMLMSSAVKKKVSTNQRLGLIISNCRTDSISVLWGVVCRFGPSNLTRPQLLLSLRC